MNAIKIILCFLSGKHFKEFVQIQEYYNGKRRIGRKCSCCGRKLFYKILRSQDGKNTPVKKRI